MKFTSVGSGFPSSASPKRNRVRHGSYLNEKLSEIWKSFDREQVRRHFVGLKYKNGLYLEFHSSINFELLIKSLESISRGIQLLSTKRIDTPDGTITSALVYIPSNQKGYFLRKITQYINENNNQSDKPKNQALIESIEEIQMAILESFWQSDMNEIPEDIPKWCEAWIRYDSKAGDIELESFFEDCNNLEIEVREEYLRFPERIVCLIKSNQQNLSDLIQQNDYLAEFRISNPPISHWIELTNVEQFDWVQNLLNRSIIENTNNTRILILDTGINNGHKLIEQVLSDSDLHTYLNEWGVSDDRGHGTLMSGIAAYGYLEKVLFSNQNLELNHTLESGKILPPYGENDRHLYGFITSEVISHAEIEAPEAKRIITNSITERNNSTGSPTSWSGALDKLCFGEEGSKRLIISASGNVDFNDFSVENKYPDLNLVSSVQSPSQAWNVLTIGAFTSKTTIADPNLLGYTPMAPAGGLSPFSSTSVLWESKWPIKPDVLFEGGNLAIDDNYFISESDDLSLLSTSHRIQQRQFDTFQMTSAATAMASYFAATIQHNYPNAWPETVRGLIVHSANWTQVMKEYFLNEKQNRQGYLNLIRTCGYGIPNIQEALYCSENHLTLIAQEHIQPFDKIGKKVKTKDMHFYDMPWPESILLELGSTKVKLKVTLSYFIEPGPGEIGWKDKYRYRSHGLGFDVNTFNETKTEFITRINKAAREDGQEITKNDSERWIIGNAGKIHGSIHSDFIEGTAAELSTCKYIAVYPLIGWWKERDHLNKYSTKTRYCLIVSIQTPEIEMDIYTPVAAKMKVPVITL